MRAVLVVKIKYNILSYWWLYFYFFLYINFTYKPVIILFVTISSYPEFCSDIWFSFLMHDLFRTSTGSSSSSVIMMNTFIYLPPKQVSVSFCAVTPSVPSSTLWPTDHPIHDLPGKQLCPRHCIYSTAHHRSALYTPSHYCKALHRTAWHCTARCSTEHQGTALHTAQHGTKLHHTSGCSPALNHPSQY